MCKVISVANIKGGVAKTTTAANLGVGLVKKGEKSSFGRSRPTRFAFIGTWD